MVNQTLSTLDKAGMWPPTPSARFPSANATQFENRLREFLITKLVQNGAVVQQNLGQALGSLPRYPGRATTATARTSSWPVHHAGCRLCLLPTACAMSTSTPSWLQAWSDLAADYANSINPAA